jgi:cytochrome c551/c552
VLIFALAIPNALAAPNEIKLPPETAKLRPSKLPGYALALQKCMICHSVDYIDYQPPGMNQTQWTAEVAKMQHAFGAPISDDEVKQIGAYLAVVYGTAKATDASVMAASNAATTPAAAASSASAETTTSMSSTAIDVQALLNAHACLGCHAIDKKVLRSYRDVARQMRVDAQARLSSKPVPAKGCRAGARCRCRQAPA